MNSPTLTDIVKPTAKDLARTRQHPAYLETMQRLDSAGSEVKQTFVSINDTNRVRAKRDSVAQEIKEDYNFCMFMVHI